MARQRRDKTIVIPENMANATNRLVLARYDLSISSTHICSQCALPPAVRRVPAGLSQERIGSWFNLGDSSLCSNCVGLNAIHFRENANRLSKLRRSFRIMRITNTLFMDLS